VRFAVCCFIAMLQCDAAMARRKVNREPAAKARLVAALHKANGIVTDACKKARVDRTLFYQWMKDDPDFATAVSDTSEVAIDFAEHSLFDQIRRKEAAATIFYLKTKGKKRGYVERQEITGADGAPVTPNPFSTLDDQTLLKIASDLLKANAESGASARA